MLNKNPAAKHLPVMITLLLIIMLCLSITYWGLRLFRSVSHAVPTSVPERQAAPDLNVAGRLFGISASADVLQFQLTGIIVANPIRHSVAILTINGKPGQAIRIGAEIVPGVTVQEVHTDHVLLLDAGIPKRIALPSQKIPNLLAPDNQQSLHAYNVDTMP